MNNFVICLPFSALYKVSSIKSKFATNECGLFVGSSCTIGVKYTFFRDKRVAIFFKFVDKASFVAKVITKGLLFLK